MLQAGKPVQRTGLSVRLKGKRIEPRNLSKQDIKTGKS
jgi:hypothetical protein